MLRSFFTALFFSILFISNGQPCAGPGGGPTQANAVCGNLTFHQPDVNNCTGGGNLPNNTSGCGDIVTTDNSKWYKFHCYQAGNMGFVLTPLNLGDDFDWAILDVTGHSPNDVYTTELWVSLNLSGQTGKTGCTPGGSLNVNCAGGNPGSQFNQLVNLVAGHDYLLMVNNWSSSNQGYDIDFSGTAVLTDNANPVITNVSTVGCDPSKIKIDFSEDIRCATITPTGSEFNIVSGSNVVGVTSVCIPGAGVPSIIINLQTPLTPNTYTLTIANGTDGDTFENVCRRLLVPTSIQFTIPVPTPLDITSVTFASCAPTYLDINFSKPFLCSSGTLNGSEITITPGNYPISSAAYNSCIGDKATKFTIALQQPLPYGSYQLNIAAGADGNTIRDTCGIDMPVGYSFPFVVPQTTVAPVIQSVSFDDCHPDKVVLNFDKPVMCGSLAADGSDFSITPGIWAITNLNSYCINGITTKVELTLQNDLPAGSFNANVITGSDGNSIGDTCYAFVTGAYSKPFVTTQAPAPKFDSVQFDKCSPTEIKVFYDKPINCGTVVAFGGQWYITGPSPVSIVSVSSSDCSSLGRSNWFTLQLAAPITNFGTYVLHNRTIGAFTIADTCKAKQDPNETISFNILGLPNPAFTTQVIWACEMDTIVFSHPGGNGINSWQWVFSDGTTASGQTVRHAFPITTLTVNAELTISNGFCSATSNQDVVLGNTFTPAFTQLPKDTTCVNTPITFTDASIGSGLQYLWDFGDNTQFNGQTPPPHTYTNPDKYNIELRITDSHGCMDTARSTIVVTAMGTLDFIGLKPQYCTGNKLTLTKVASPNIDYYIWDNGNGKTFENYRFIEFSYPEEKSYTITLSGNDKYCGAVTVSKTVPVYAVPKVDLGKDTVLCPDAFMQIGVANNPNYMYSWNTGAITSQITTDIFTRKYGLTVDNHGCKASDSIAIKLLPACLIKVPGAFTPNADGNNDKLRAVNADLARSFSLRVYNRFGQLLFSTNDPMQGWDGTYKGVKQENAAYVWELNYINPWTNKPVSEKGTAILLR